MSSRKVGILLLLFYFDPIICKGLYSGVPCHRPYFCILGNQDDPFEESQLLSFEEGIEDEKTCQELCLNLEGCVSYTWWNEKATDHPDGRPFLCQMFAVCNRRYQNPNLTPVYSGPSQCKNPIIVFGGDGEDRIDPKIVETIWPGYDDKFDDSGYVTINDFDPIPEVPELSYASFWYSSAVQLDTDLILSCGGGYPGTAKCFGLDLVTGSWKPMASMNYARTVGFTLVIVGNGVLAIGGTDPKNALIEVYNRDFDFWTPMDQWNGPFDHTGLSSHCAVAIDDHQVMVIGGAWRSTLNTSMILDINTGAWKNTAPNPNPRGKHACLATTINGTFGVLVTGGTEFRTDPNDYYPGSQVDFYQLEMDSWITLANSSFPVYDHQMVLYGNQPTIIGGEYETFLIEIEADWIHKRDHVQIYEEFENHWFCCIPSMNYKRSKFVAVAVEMQ